MEFIRGLKQLQSRHQGAVVTIGNFDGLHRGHQHLLEQVDRKAQELQVPRVLLCFEPHPREYFQGHDAPARLTRLREKLLILQKMPVDYVVVLGFNAELAGLSAPQFVEHILVRGLAARCVVIGDDFRFGQQRQGDVKRLSELGEQAGFTVEQLSSYVYAGQRVSSTAIRNALAESDLETAALLLGRPYTMCGRVAHGDEQGRRWGFPTANIHLARRVAPLHGVYMVKVTGAASQIQYGVANVGTRPTLKGQRSLLEVHLLDFNQAIYGRYLEVEFVKKLRDEVRFESVELLKQQIAADVEAAKRYWAGKLAQ